MVYFISDLHLGATYLPDARLYEQRVVDWLGSIRHDATELYMLGDILDYWFEYRTVVPRGYVRFFGALASLADAGVEIYWFIGNHDIWLFDYLRDEIGMTVIDGVLEKDILGKRFFLTHGDGVGRLPRSFRILRAIFRNRVCQKLYSGIHPRWTIPFAHRWSTSSRDFCKDDIPRFAGPDSEPLVCFSEEYSASHPDIDYFIYGHRHVLVDYALSTGAHMVILGDWIHHFSYGAFDGAKLSLYRWDGDKGVLYDSDYKNFT
ncbi:UDP-2,3-diacylglucosamine diphosphatase [uncultured Muribaculum sp.]|uniref:UDP-2,3-diacylglucosamine diphosphatase n=1 Tax=uncultured Muribaculum sp. TaxID=1918613 RepID=UPI0025EAC7EC|nr:UDP-2,3-diacylglucosamine diphosphatase [uncultured Muribaculum sp.]